MDQRVLWIGMVLISGGCTNSDSPRQKALDASERHLRDKDIRLSTDRVVTIKRTGEGMVVTYHLPPDATGGDYTVLVDEKTMKVKAAIGGQ